MAGIDLYNKKVLEHFFTPRNIGEIENPDGLATVGDPRCGDFIKVWISVENQTIVDFKYKVFGCGAAIATTSMVSELAMGKTVREALRLTDDDVIASLGGLPEGKKHCSLLGIQGLQAAIADFTVKDNRKRYAERIGLYHSLGYDIPVCRARLAARLAQLPTDARILDVGCGKGHLSIAIAQTGRQCVAVDYSKDNLQMAYLNAVYYGVEDKIDFQEQDACKLNFESKSFDAVVSADLIHHLQEVEPALSEMLRVCTSHGMVIVADLNEKGRQVIERLHENEGRKHRVNSWSMGRVQEWFQDHQCDVTAEEDDCQTVSTIVLNFK